MNFEKYPKSKFESLASDPSAIRRLADELQDDVVQEIHEAVLTAFLRVVDGLNAEGHDLRLSEEIRPGDIAYRDEPGEGKCNLRLGCDLVISAGYSDQRAWRKSIPRCLAILEAVIASGMDIGLLWRRNTTSAFSGLAISGLLW